MSLWYLDDWFFEVQCMRDTHTHTHTRWCCNVHDSTSSWYLNESMSSWYSNEWMSSWDLDSTHLSRRRVWDTYIHTHTLSSWRMRDRGTYSISRGRSLYCLYFGFSQFMGPEAYSWIFVPVLLGGPSNRSLYQTFSVNLSLLYQAVGTQPNDEKSFEFDLLICKVFGNVYLRPHALMQKERIYWKYLVKASVA